jgi:NAD(P)-dependent dehydrogenase (short-subunit alcohol dehydrogenase family)
MAPRPSRPPSKSVIKAGGVFPSDGCRRRKTGRDHGAGPGEEVWTHRGARECRGRSFYGTILETVDAAWERVMNINLKGTFLCCRAVLSIMLQKGSGSIVNFSSTAGAHDACAHAVAYVTSKGGVAAFTRAVSIDHARQGIRINAICPLGQPTHPCYAGQSMRRS